MQSTRRQFLHRTLTGATALGIGVGLPGLLPAFGDESTAAPRRKLKLLILGGTRFLGPHTVEAALARGHEMTLFNRGKTNPHLFPRLEKLRGDRYGDMSALKGRKWDAVIDTFTYVPRVVEASARLLADAVGQYVVISSISVYPNYKVIGMTETAPVATLPPEEVARVKTHRDVTGENYGALKALCEQAAERVMPGRVTNIRPGLIVGPRDPSDRFTYWPVRVARGGEVLAPGTPGDFVQFIDVRDLAAWIITCVENHVVGVYNADAPAGSITMGRMLAACRSASGSSATFTWVPADFLAEHKVRPWADMPVWSPAVGDEIGFGQVSTRKAVRCGLKFRPLEQTAGDTLRWFRTLPEKRQAKLRTGIKPEREKQVLAAWHARKPASAPAGG